MFFVWKVIEKTHSELTCSHFNFPIVIGWQIMCFSAIICQISRKITQWLGKIVSWVYFKVSYLRNNRHQQNLLIFPSLEQVMTQNPKIYTIVIWKLYSNECFGLDRLLWYWIGHGRCKRFWLIKQDKAQPVYRIQLNQGMWYILYISRYVSRNVCVEMYKV